MYIDTISYNVLNYLINITILILSLTVNGSIQFIVLPTLEKLFFFSS